MPSGGIGRLRYAFVAGTSAALGSFFGKLTSADARVDLLPPTVWTLPADSLILTIICASLMLLCNAMVWTFFVRALHSAGGSLVATVTSASTNYCLSAFLGWAVFGETTSLLWCSGTACVIVGLLLIGTDGSLLDEETDKNK